MNLKTLFITTLVISLTTTTMAQTEYNRSYWQVPSAKNLPINYSPSKNVHQITYSQKDKKGKTKIFLKKYNKEGKIIEFHSTGKSGELMPLIVYEYHNSGKVNKIDIYLKGVIKTITKFERTKEGALTLQEKTNARGKTLLKNTWKYNKKGRLIGSTRFKRDGETPKNIWVYEYNSEGEKTRSILLNGKGKAKHEWTFDCDDEGEKLEKIADKTQVCKWTQNTDQYLIQVYQALDEKGRIVKHVSKWTLKDTLILELSVYDGDEQLTYHSTYDKAFEKLLTVKNYYKGKMRREQSNDYLEDLLVKSVIYWKGKLTHRSEYTYKDDLLTERISFNKKNELYRTITLEYVL